MSSETMVDVLARLAEQGYVDQCRATAAGLRFLQLGDTFDPEDVRVDEVIRLEGNSVPSEEAAVFAIRSPNGAIGATYCVAHGPEMDPMDVAMMARLEVTPGDAAANDDTAYTAQH